MTRQDKLDILILLSAVESWTFSMQKTLPDYLHERLSDTMRMLEKEVLDGSTESG